MGVVGRAVSLSSPAGWMVQMVSHKLKLPGTGQIAEVVNLALMRCGGVKPALSKVLALFKRDGWRGLKRNWAYLHDQQRREKALVLVNRQGLGLEIGPSHNPIASKKQGFNVHILDHASAEELRAKYTGHGVNLDNIEEVDFIWRGEPLGALIGRRHCYDWIIASHVIEHIPDLVSFFEECEWLLKEDGVLSLIIPDKRYCFDYVNGTTSTGELLDAFEQKRTRPSPGKVFDHYAGATKRNGHIAWDSQAEGPIEFVHQFAEAMEQWQRARTTDQYIDVHNWRFTPASFRVLLNDLRALKLVQFEIKAEFNTSGCEFFVTLGRSNTAPSSDRMSIVQRYLDETPSQPSAT